MDYNLLDRGANPKHVDRKLLYTSLEERIKYLHGFLNFNTADVEALITGTKYLKPLIPTVVHLVYKKLLESDITSRAFYTRTTVEETEPDDGYLTTETPQIKRRKMFLRWYLVRLCQDPTKMEFWRYLNKVGMMHCGHARMARLNIEYIHINVCLGYVQDIITEAILSHPELSLKRKTALLRAIGKVLWIQNDLFARWYVRDGEEFANEMDETEGNGREGYVGNKRILGSNRVGSISGISDISGISIMISSNESSPIDDEQASITSKSSITDSVASGLARSSSVRTASTARSNTVQSPTPTPSLTPITPSLGSGCPFADLVKGASTETKIWAN